MQLTMNAEICSDYHSNSQIARVLTETWMGDNMFCPHCGNANLTHFANNSPVADFYCSVCHNQYELKSKQGSLSSKINDGAYETMIERITSNTNPDFFFMSYSKQEWIVKDLILIPKHFFVPEIIEKRKPLADTARRAGWIGCNILLNQIPIQGRIAIVSNGCVNDKNSVINNVKKSNDLKIPNIKSRGWLFDILRCVNRIPSAYFTLDDVYAFENLLQEKYQNNNNIKAKIRQQLQFLRDKNLIEFLGNGRYRKNL